jgi:hypothetical protein
MNAPDPPLVTKGGAPEKAGGWYDTGTGLTPPIAYLPEGPR